MSKGRRKNIGGFEVGQHVVAGKYRGKIDCFPTRRIAVLRLGNGDVVEVSTRDLKAGGGK